MEKLTTVQAATNVDKAKEKLKGFTDKKQKEITAAEKTYNTAVTKINLKYAKDIHDSTQGLNEANKVLLKLVQPPQSKKKPMRKSTYKVHATNAPVISNPSSTGGEQ